MSARSFRSVFMVATCAGAALTCYLVSLRVASERAALEQVENEIVLAQRDIRLLQTEIGTRGRLAQLERWNARVLALSAPSADQFLEGGFQLARLARPEPKLNVEAPVVLASAPAPQPRSVPLEVGERETGGAGASIPVAQLMREASLRVPVREAARDVPIQEVSGTLQSAPKTPRKDVVEGKKPTAKKAGDKAAETVARPVTKPVRMAKVDPLAPLPDKRSARTSKDSAAAR